MSNAREPPTFRAELQLSKRLGALLTAGHLTAMGVAMALAVVDLWFLPLCAAVTASWLWVMERHVRRRSSRSIVALELKNECACALRMRGGDWIHGQLQPTSYALPWLVVLHIAIDGRPFGVRVAIFPDTLTPEAHRLLRTRVRWAHYGDGKIDRMHPPL